MSIPRGIVFVDGENLVFRYQSMIAEGRTPAPGVIHERDVFVWHPKLTQWCMMNLIRVYVYTSMVGDDASIARMKKRISEVSFEYDYGRDDDATGSGQLVPIVFKKAAKSQKSRQVDIQIAIDMMRFANNAGIEMLYLVSGDGDYLPLLQEVTRLGKEVYLGALSSGLAPELQWVVDDFRTLDPLLFSAMGTSAAGGPDGRKA